MKKAFRFSAIGVALSLTIALVGCGGAKTTEDGYSTELNFYNWTEYMPNSVMEAFKKEYGITVNVDTFSSNEELLTKLLAGGTSQYDLSVATHYMVPPFKEQGLIQEIDKENITNFDNLDSRYIGLDYDKENKLSIPYMVSWTAIGVNKDKYDKEITTFDDLLDTDLADSIVVPDDPREIIGIALISQGKDPNSRDKDEIMGTLDWIKDLSKNIRKYDSDNPKSLFVTGEVKAGYTWNAEIALAARENPSIVAVFPDHSLYCIDAFIITNGAKNKREAELFIDFCLRPEISAMITNDYPYTNPNAAALPLLGEEYTDNPAVNVPQEIIDKATMYEDVGEAVTYYEELWNLIKN